MRFFLALHSRKAQKRPQILCSYQFARVCPPGADNAIIAQKREDVYIYFLSKKTASEIKMMVAPLRIVCYNV